VRVTGLIPRSISTVGWGLFCASSWTWCIGMFLPVIMIDRFGWWGFLAFAAPNVLGCAAFGYVVANRAKSERMIRDHRTAMRTFSVVTIAYHVFFIAMMCWLLLPLTIGDERFLLAVIAPPAIVSLGVVLSNLPDRAWPGFAAIVYAISLGIFAIQGVDHLRSVPWSGAVESVDLWWLLPVLCFGFLLSPYLDLTFHRALRRSPSRHSFSIFGLAFAVMIVLTCTYWDALREGLIWIIATHIVAQSCFTVAAHIRELRFGQAIAEQAPARSDRPRRWDFALLLVLSLIALPLAFAGEVTGEPLQTSIEMYLRFLVFYGLAFPAYVLLFITQREAKPSNVRTIRHRSTLAVFALFLVIFAGIYEAGFIHGHYMLMPVPMAAILGWWAYDRFIRPSAIAPSVQHIDTEAE
jgi:hypothetical protein